MDEHGAPVSLEHLEASVTHKLVQCSYGLLIIAQKDDATSPLSALERAAHDETLNTLCELFPSHTREQLEVPQTSGA